MGLGVQQKCAYMKYILVNSQCPSLIEANYLVEFSCSYPIFAYHKSMGMSKVQVFLFSGQKVLIIIINNNYFQF